MALPGGFDLDYRLLSGLKALLASSAFGLLLWDLRFGTQASARWLRIRNRGLAAIGILSLAAWWNFGSLHGSGSPLHFHDFFHYYIGSKYYAELGYTRIYQCVAVAEVQSGRTREVAERWTRNLETNQLERRVPGRAETDECLSRFGQERWREFRADVEWFHSRMQPATWAGVPMVFGHNATPVWNAIGYSLTAGRPASDRQLLALAAIDPILLGIMWLVVWRTFGMPAACVAAIWWGLNSASAFRWVGGGFLRQDALFCIVLAVCAMRTGRNLLAGFALGTAALLRAFPVFLLAGLFIGFLHAIRTRGVQRALGAYRATAAGVAIAVIILLMAATVTWSGRWGGPLEPWTSFARNSQKHLTTPIANHLGLKPALWFSPDTRAARISAYWLDGPWDTWRAARTTTAESRKPLHFAIALLFIVLFWFAVRAADDWIALVAGVTLLPFATTLANYYYSVLLLLGLLWPIDKRIGVGLAGLTALSAILPAFVDRRDDEYVIISAAVVLFAFFVVLRLARMARVSGRVHATHEAAAAAPPRAGA